MGVAFADNRQLFPPFSEVVQLLSFDFMGVYDYESLSLGRVERQRGEGKKKFEV